MVPKDIPIGLVGNKNDLEEGRKVSTEDVKKLAEEKNMLFFEKFAKKNENVEEIFNKMLETILEKK